MYAKESGIAEKQQLIINTFTHIIQTLTLTNMGTLVISVLIEGPFHL
jgi:hypothetical protein